MLENTPNQPSKFTTKHRIKVNDESRGTYNVNSQIKFKTSMLRSSLCDYSDTYIILVSATITVPNNVRNYWPFTNCISEIDNTQIDNAEDINIVMPMYNSIEHNDNYSKTSLILWYYYRY